MLFTLASCGDKHTWVAADCDTPKTCSVCGETEGEALGHNYTDTVTVKATTFKTGTVIRSCDCGHSYEETLPATKSLKILAIGNSFSQDALVHLYAVCKDAGIETVLLGNLYKGASSLDMHLSYMKNNSREYTFYLSSDAQKGLKKYKEGATAKEAIEYAD